jgi:DNA polymerase-1
MVFDTETTGLNVLVDKPFLIGFGFGKNLYVYDPRVLPQVTNILYELSEQTKYLFAHNAKFDYHMMGNGGQPIPSNVRVADSMTVARLTEYADNQDSISLETLGMKYVDPNAKFAGKVIKEKLKQIKAERVKDLKKVVKMYLAEKNSKCKVASLYSTYTNMIQVGFHITFHDFLVKNDFSHLLSEFDTFTAEDAFSYLDMFYQEPNYEDVYIQDPDLMISYLFDDLVVLNEYLLKALPTLAKTDPQERIMSQECELIPVVARMERVGLRADVKYLLDSRERVIKYKNLLYRHLRRLTGQVFTSGQHQVIKDYFLNKHGIYLANADVKALSDITKGKNKHARVVAETIVELRTIDKWLSTYIEGMLDRVYNGRIYTNINNAGTVTGRVSSDMQQQPKDPLVSRSGKELFHPRKVFITDEGTKTYYFDFQAMELRLQAHYTIKVAGGDYNLCNAFMPFKHKSMYTGEEFVYGKHDYQSGEWVNEQGDLWQPTDPHTETTLKAFPWITKDHPEFKHYRSLGKRANFLKNYGGGYGAIMTQLDLPEEIAKDLDQAYYKAFPQVLDYQRWTNRQLTKYGYTENLFGRRYYFQSASNFYKDFNYMIQGGCADLMKRKEILIDRYLMSNNLKSKLVLVVHDEAQVIVYDDEPFVVDEIKKIMNNNPEIDTLPMTAGIEVSMTNWAEKEEIE